MPVKRSERPGESGSVLLEFTVTIFVFLVVLFGVIEFSLAFYQWNAATKAAQFGARYAATSNPVLQQLPSIDGLKAANAGDDFAGNFDVLCDGSLPTPACKCTGSECPGTLTYLPDNMTAIVNAMKKAYPNITSKNVTVRYDNTYKLGYAGRPGGPVPTVTVSLKGVKFNFILLSFLIPGSITMPGLSTTVTGEDLNAGWSS